MRLHTLLLVIATLSLNACLTAEPLFPNNAERGILSTKMVNLSSAVDTHFSTLPGRPSGSDEQILKEATRRDERLMAPEFKPYTLRVDYQNPYAVILLCSKDGKQAIMEDAGCSAVLDRQVNQPATCEFTLTVNQVCQVNGADAH